MGNIQQSKPNQIIDENGVIYNSLRELSRQLNISRRKFRDILNNGEIFKYKNHSYKLVNVQNSQNQTCQDKEYEDFLKAKEIKSLPFESYSIKVNSHKKGTRYAIALFSDAHIEERVLPQSVQFLNEYNIKIAEDRIKRYFANLSSCLNEDKVEHLFFASLGDTISGYIHEELSQNNELSPLEATYKAQSLLLSGLKYLCENTSLKSIKFIGIVGNHSRVTKKIQHANGYRMSYEWLMYMNIKEQASLMKLPIEFYIPESEMAIIDTDDKKRYIFVHGFQIKGSNMGTVCGIYPALNRLSMKWDKTFKQDKIFLGHFHSCVSIPNATVNGSIIGYNSFALSNGLPFEEPAQMYELYDTSIGLLLTRKIYCK